MYRIKSTVGRSWPAHSFVVNVGDNAYPRLDEACLRFVAPFVEGGMMVLTEEDDAAPAALADPAPDLEPPAKSRKG